MAKSLKIGSKIKKRELINTKKEVLYTRTSQTLYTHLSDLIASPCILLITDKGTYINLCAFHFCLNFLFSFFEFLRPLFFSFSVHDEIVEFKFTATLGHSSLQKTFYSFMDTLTYSLSSNGIFKPHC